MGTGRLEAFTDAVIAIIITIMVLELRVPDEPTLAGFWHTTWIGLLSYVLSFLYIAIYWIQHHHTLHLVERVSGGILWSNFLLLFWLSLLPFTTKWTDETGFALFPVVLYGLNLFLAALSAYLLQIVIVRNQGEGSVLGAALGRDVKGKISPVLFILGLASAWVDTRIAMAIFLSVALLWVIPDRRLERLYAGES